MKKQLLNLKKCALQVVLLCSILFGWSSSVFGFTVYFDNTNTNWSKVYIYLYDKEYWGNNGSGSESSKGTKVGPVEMTKVDGNIYSYNNSNNYTIVSFTKDNQSGYGNFWQTEAAYSDGTNFNVTGTCSSDTPLFIAGTDTETKNQNVPYYSGEWSTYPPTPPAPPTCSDFSIPSEVLSGDNIMFYIEGHYEGGDDKTTGITNGSSTNCLGTSVKIDKKKSYINIAKTSIPDNIYMSNNCGGWKGDGPTPKSDIKAGKYHTYNNSGTVDATTLVTFSASETTIAVGTEKVNLTIKGSSQYSSFKGSNYKLYCLVLLDGTCAGVVEVQTTDQLLELNTSSLTEGVHTVQSVLTDKKIYYLDASLDITVGSTASYTIEAKATTGGSIEGTAKYTDQPEGATQSFTASEPQTGYNFDGWTATNEAVISAPEELTTNITIGAFSTVATANYSEILSTISVSAGEGGSVDQSSVSVGVSTSAQIIATPNSGYKFKEWTLTNVSLASGSTTDATISIKSDGSGEAGTAVASFEFNPSTGWYLRGSFSDKGWSSDGQIEFLAAQGQASGIIGTATLQYDKTDNFEVKVFTLENGSTEKWCGGDNTTISETTSDVDIYYGSGNNISIKPSIIGDYKFTLKKSGDNYYMDVTYPEIIEIKSIITVSVASECTSMGTVSPSGNIEIGDKIAAQISAMPIGSYKLSTWVLGGSAVLASGSLTDATISIKADGSGEAGTAVATFEEDPDAKVVKYLNINNWDVVYIHMWDGTKDGTTWHGLPMAKTGEQKYGYDVYSISIKEGDYKKCIFNNNNNQQSADLVFGKDDAQLEPDYTKLVYGFGKWYASLDDIPEPEYITLVYVNKAGWSDVYIQMKGGSQSMDWPGVAMTKTDDKKFGFDVYSYTFMKGQYTKYIINKGDGGGQIEKDIEEGKYVHYNGSRYATLEDIPLPSLSGDFNSWSADANTFELNDEFVGSTTITLSANETYEFKVIDGSMLGNNGTITENISGWTMKVEDNNCKITTKNKGEFTFTYDVKTSKLSVTYPEFNDNIDMIVTNAEGESVVEMTKNPSAEKEYYKYGLFLRTGDVVTFYDHYSLKAFKPKAIDTGASISNVATITDNGLEITQSINTNFYLILEAGNDKVQLQHGYKVLDEIAPNAFLSEIDGQTVNLTVIRPMSSDCLNTLCLPFNLDKDQINTYFPDAEIAELSYAEVEKVGLSYKTYLRFTRVNSMQAGMPYLIQPASNITDEPILFENVTIDKNSKTKTGDIVDAVGILTPTELQKDAYNYIFMGAGNQLYYPNVTGTMRAMRAYFYIKDSAPVGLLMGATPKKLKAYPVLMSIENSDTEEELTTETDEIESEGSKTYKIYNENNEVIIVIENEKYNLLSQPVKE